MKPQRRKALEEFVGRACARFGGRISDMILFGSVARGEDKSDSDIDLLVTIDKEDFRLRWDLIGIAFDVLLETGEDISVRALSKEDFEEQKSFSFLKNVLSEGVKIA